MMSEATLSGWAIPWTGVAAAWPAGQAAERRMDGDAELIESCLHGDRRAWEDLVHSHTRLVYGACYRFTGAPEDSRDLTQEVFVRVFRSLHTYDPRAGAFRTWLIRLTRNLLIDHYRKTRRERVVDSLEEQLPTLEEKSSYGGRSDRTLASRETNEVLQLALQKLSPELREAVILRDLQDMEYKQIAHVLKIAEGTVKSRINRGRCELARRLRALGVRP